MMSIDDVWTLSNCASVANSACYNRHWTPFNSFRFVPYRLLQTSKFVWNNLDHHHPLRRRIYVWKLTIISRLETPSPPITQEPNRLRHRRMPISKISIKAGQRRTQSCIIETFTRLLPNLRSFSRVHWPNDYRVRQGKKRLSGGPLHAQPSQMVNMHIKARTVE
jgi:hypothetical protein